MGLSFGLLWDTWDNYWRYLRERGHFPAEARPVVINQINRQQHSYATKNESSLTVNLKN